MDHTKFHSLHSVIMLCGITSSSVAFGADASLEAQFKAMDANGDGKVSPDEPATGAKQMFAAMDANQDDIVTGGENGRRAEKVTGK